MALEKPLNKRPGDHLRASEVNDLSAVAARSSGTPRDGGLLLRDFSIPTVRNPLAMTVVEVGSTVTDANDNPIDGLFNCVIRSYLVAPDEIDGGWVTCDNENVNHVYLLDSSGLSSSPSVGDQISAWWHKNRGAFIPVIGGASSIFYQLIGDNDSGTYMAKANPGAVDPETGWLYDPHAGETNPDNTSWTVYAIDQTGQTPCWAGDWVEVESFSLTVGTAPNEYSTVLIKRRASAQLSYWGQLGENKLWYESAAAALVFINGAVHSKIVWDNDLLKPGEYLDEFSPIIATFFPDGRLWCVTAAPCGPYSFV